MFSWSRAFRACEEISATPIRLDGAPAAKPHRLRDAMRPARIASAKNAPQAPQAAAAPFRHRRARDPTVQVMVHRPARHPSRRGRRQHTRRRRIFPGVGRGVAGPMRLRRTPSSAQQAEATRHWFTGSSGPATRGLTTSAKATVVRRSFSEGGRARPTPTKGLRDQGRSGVQARYNLRDRNARHREAWT